MLIIDDDFAVQTSLSLLLNQNDYETVTASNPDEALEVIKEVKLDLIILDMNFTMETTGEEGLALLKEIKNLLPAIPVILITAWGSISLAVEGMKAGAVDFITKPWSNEFFLQSVRTALCLSKDTEQKLTRKQIDSKYNFESTIGKDPVFVAALETVGRVSKTDASVLILGESGTGKELIAEAIHKNSSRKNQPFVKVNLGGISSSLFESEMFGHIKGSFTDARYDRIGRFEMANKGTIFLDEIGELDINMQVKLLRVLQDRTFEVLGSSKPRTVNVRVICATNRDLEEMVNNNEFREDLYYRINLISLKLPALRERAEDIPLLVNYFIKTLQNKYKRPGLQINKQAMNWLKGLSWSGNIRELKNLVERAVVISNKNNLELDNFTKEFIIGPQKITSKKLPDVGSMTLEEIEKAMILKALKENKNLSRVARALGISRAALYRRMEKFGISV
ncbi:MAG: sigma-54-dependent Fis family transcriptional regulator [Armatimonadetes bacterium]|nr:sigma-54-dependent Fis family transcriptional regulator [Armatimonadota bacterium]